ncbi:MAG TPA: LysR substrate-binding domain-containing protein, partial [Albitalea sp.]|nr:LysR substrate-binding domain-containing protein [Albitalea sp.]
EKERIDLAVRYCPEAQAPAGAQRLFGEKLRPVCSPALAGDRKRALKNPADLAHHVLLHFDDGLARYPWLNWPQWLAAIGIDHLEPKGSLRFSHYDMVIQAALGGQGVALGRSPLVDHLLAQGALVAPFRRRVDTQRAYFIVRGIRSERRAETQAFIDWLLAQARDEAQDAT